MRRHLALAARGFEPDACSISRSQPPLARPRPDRRGNVRRGSAGRDMAHGTVGERNGDLV